MQRAFPTSGADDSAPCTSQRLIRAYLPIFAAKPLSLGTLGSRPESRRRPRDPRPALTLHLLQLAHVQVEEGVDALRLSVPVNVQLDVCREATAQTQGEQNKGVCQS